MSGDFWFWLRQVTVFLAGGIATANLPMERLDQPPNVWKLAFACLVAIVFSVIHLYELRRRVA